MLGPDDELMVLSREPVTNLDLSVLEMEDIAAAVAGRRASSGVEALRRGSRRRSSVDESATARAAEFRVRFRPTVAPDAEGSNTEEDASEKPASVASS